MEVASLRRFMFKIFKTALDRMGLVRDWADMSRLMAVAKKWILLFDLSSPYGSPIRYSIAEMPVNWRINSLNDAIAGKLSVSRVIHLLSCIDT